MYTRRNQRNLTSSQRQRFVEAVVELKRTGAYEKYVTTHAQYFAADGETGQRVAHMAPSFFPWHRYFVLLFERDLQLLDSKITVPYWDWTVDRGKNAALWGADFMGGDGRDSDGQVMTGPFAYRSGHWTITNGVTTERYLTRNMGRPSQPIALPTAAELNEALGTAVYDTAPWNSAPSTQGFRNKMEGWTVSPAKGGYLHNRVHQWVGGHMVSGTSPNDPVFWLHHSFMDLIWVRWQRRHPSSRYQPQRRLAGSDPEHGRVISSDEPMPPWGVRPSQIMDHRRFYTYE